MTDPSSSAADFSAGISGREATPSGSYWRKQNPAASLCSLMGNPIVVMPLPQGVKVEGSWLPIKLEPGDEAVVVTRQSAAWTEGQWRTREEVES